MEFNYDAFKQTFVDYFTSKGYKTLVSNRDHDLIFMYSAKENISVIELWNSEDQAEQNIEELNRLVKKIADAKSVEPDEIKTLLLFFDAGVKPSSKLEGNTFKIVASDPQFIKDKLKPKYSDIEQAKVIDNPTEFKKITSSKKMTRTKVDDQDLNSINDQQQLQQKANQLTMTIKNSNALAPLIFMILFLAIPLIISIVTMVWGANMFGLEAARLFQGGTVRDLTIEGHQVWRILTWGLSTPSDNFIVAILVILIAGWSAYNMMKLTEFNMKPWKFIVGFIAAYILTGFFASALPGFAMGGVMPVLGIAAGMLALSTSAKQTLVATVSKMKIVWPIVLMIIFPIFTGGGYEYLYEIMGFAIGGSIAYLISYDYKNAGWPLVLPILILIVAILLPILLMTIPMFGLAVDNSVVMTLEMYIKKGYTNLDGANKVIHNIGYDMPDIKKVGGTLNIPFIY